MLYCKRGVTSNKHQKDKDVREKLRAAVVRQRQRYNMQAPAFKVGA